jgi:predicted  nucleic acid-binding Zn-ribbon protein
MHFLMGRLLSEAVKLSSKEAKSWLERETGSLLAPIHSKAQKLLNEMRKALESLSEVSKMLLENSGKEIEKRNMKTYGRARALNKLAKLFVDRMRQIKIPEKVTYDSFHDFVQETQRAFLVTDVDIRNYFPHISPFFILDRRKFQVVFEKAKGSLKELNNFLTKEYVKIKTLEDTFQLVEKLQTLEQQLTNFKEQKTKSESEEAQLSKTIAETRQKTDELKAQGSLGQLNKIDSQIEALNSELKQRLQHLQKPFVKLQSLALHGEGSGLTPEEISKLNQYIDKPFEAFTSEEPNHPLLNQILKKLSVLMTQDKLKLKPEKTRKAEQLIQTIFSQNSLADLHQRSLNALSNRKQLLMSPEVAETEKHLSMLKTQLEELERKKKIVEGERVTFEQACSETVEKIKNQKSDIEKNILAATNKRIRIE